MTNYIQFIIYIFILYISLCIGSFEQVKKHSLNNNDDNLNPLLSEKELKLIRFISYLTYMQPNITWNGWKSNYDGPQLGLDAIRYPLAHIGYTAAALAYRTPNYRELAIKILNDTIKRMLTIKVWGYIDQYWTKIPTFPDPVYHENIMYSGHLLQLITLYESLTGDFTYDNNGFYFIWDKNNDTIKKFFYTTTKLANVIYRQMLEESSGGVACEPGWVYTICQNHPHIAFKLYDINRNSQTNFSKISYKWKDFLIKHALEDIPFYKENRYFKMLYQRSTHIWLPFFAATGNDGWSLAWLSSWFDYNQTSNFVCNGWDVMYKNKYWKPSLDHTKPGCFLDAGGYIGVRMQMNSWLATSFYPIIEKQCTIERTEKLNCTYLWFDNNFSTYLDTDMDGYYESYYYETNTEFSNWVTTNILLSLLMGENNSNTKEFLRNIYSKKFYEKFLYNEPEVLNVNYPNIRVSRAEYNLNKKSLRINFNTEKPMILTTKFEIKYPNLLLNISNITRDGLQNGFTFNQISNDRISIEYSYENIDKQDTEFNILFV